MEKKKKKSKINSIINFILVLIFLAGLSLLLYPTFSEYWNSFRQSRAISSYNEQIAGMDEVIYNEAWKSARAYNKSILDRKNVYVLSDEENEDYNNQLKLTSNNVMAYVEIPKIKCSLPIYHGTSEGVLQTAIGHLEWTSLPVGGESTHCVLSGHRGLPSAKLFTDLDKLEIGDQFYIRVLNEVLNYEVDQVKVVLPEETKDLHIVEGEDYCTLFTCTPYAVNTHRLLVRGHRVEAAETGDEEGNTTVVPVVDPEVLERQRLEENLNTALMVVGGIVAVMLVLLLFVKMSKKEKKHGGDANEDE